MSSLRIFKCLVYRWLSNYGTMRKKKERLKVESESDSMRLLEMKKKIAELEQIVGQKQILLDFQDKMIELAEEHYQIDIKKTFSGKQSILLAQQKDHEL